ncbi:MAG: hypothetical protein AAF447_02765 [Myxococcota bacterium]
MHCSGIIAGIAGLFALLTAGACAAGPVAEAEVAYPAVVPVRTYPRVYVARGLRSEEVELGGRLARHLDGDGVGAELVDRQRLERERLGPGLPVASVIVLLSLEARRETRTRWTTRPETVCGATGCFTRQRTVTLDVPAFRARLEVTVLDGPSTRTLQRVSFEAMEEGRALSTMRARALGRLERRLLTMVDARVERVRIQLYDVPNAAFRAGLAALAEGRWREGRVALERAMRSEAVQDLSRRARARAHYDLAIARRFDPETLAADFERHFRVAEEPLREALRLDPRPHYADALEALRDHRDQLAVVRAQREAAAHNFALEDAPAGPGVPPPPPSYR